MREGDEEESCHEGERRGEEKEKMKVGGGGR
jgi:hypothetical protein